MAIAEEIVGKMHPEEDEEYEDGDIEKELGPNGVGMVAAMEEFMEAISSRKPVEAACCLKNFFELADASPHEEGEHE